MYETFYDTSLDEIVSALDALANELHSQGEPEIAGYNASYWRRTASLLRAADQPLTDDFFITELIEALDTLFDIMRSDRIPLLAGHKADFWLNASFYLIESIPYFGLARTEAIIILHHFFERLETDMDLVDLCPPIEIYLHGPLLTESPRVDAIGLIYICKEAMELYHRDLDDWFEEELTEGLWIQLDTVTSLGRWFSWKGPTKTRLIWGQNVDWRAKLAEFAR